jgi:hypothetical protein
LAEHLNLGRVVVAKWMRGLLMLSHRTSFLIDA